MSEARLYKFIIYERNKEDFENSLPIKKRSKWNIVLKDSFELKDKVKAHAKTAGFDKEEQCKEGLMKIGMKEELPYYLVFRDSGGAGREYSLSGGRDIIDIDRIF